MSDLNWTGALVLVSCVGKKQSCPAPAKDLYISDWFRKARCLVEAKKARWCILSAKYGLVEPNQVIDPYEKTLNTMGIAARRAWAKQVMDQLPPWLADTPRVVFLAGARYREFLIQPLQCRDRGWGIDVEIPMKGLKIGEQLAWLRRQKALLSINPS